MYKESQVGERLARLFDMAGKVALITGAAQGLGRATAELFAEVGARVLIADLNGELAHQAAAQVEARGGLAWAARVDVADEASVKSLYATLDATFGGLDILINNAAHRAKDEFALMSAAQWDTMQQVTLRGTFLCCREAIARMRASGRGGAIVNISSVGSVRTTLWGLNAHYDAAKAGVDSLTRTLGGEYAGEGIRVNSVLPGGMRSEGGQRIGASYAIRGPMTGPGRIPMGRLADPTEVAQAVLFLASPAASYITGQALAVDGGFTVS